MSIKCYNNTCEMRAANHMYLCSCNDGYVLRCKEHKPKREKPMKYEPTSKCTLKNIAVGCDNCNHSFDYKGIRQSAIKAWNKRS